MHVLSFDRRRITICNYIVVVLTYTECATLVNNPNNYCKHFESCTIEMLTEFYTKKPI